MHAKNVFRKFAGFCSNVVDTTETHNLSTKWAVRIERVDDNAFLPKDLGHHTPFLEEVSLFFR